MSSVERLPWEKSMLAVFFMGLVGGVILVLLASTSGNHASTGKHLTNYYQTTPRQ